MHSLLREWVEELEAENLDQCRSYLTNGRGYCCLGVFARLNGGFSRGIPRNRWIRSPWIPRNRWIRSPFEDALSTRISEEPIAEMLNISDSKARVVVNLLMHMNDRGKSFKYIAGVLRELDAASASSFGTIINRERS